MTRILPQKPRSTPKQEVSQRQSNPCILPRRDRFLQRRADPSVPGFRRNAALARGV
jgi:hypothetical protein